MQLFFFFPVAGLIDSMIYHSSRALQKKIELGKATWCKLANYFYFLGGREISWWMCPTKIVFFTMPEFIVYWTICCMMQNKWCCENVNNSIVTLDKNNFFETQRDDICTGLPDFIVFVEFLLKWKIKRLIILCTVWYMCQYREYGWVCFINWSPFYTWYLYKLS